MLIQTPVFGLYSIPGIWSNGVINCGSSQCASTITSLVGNTALGTSGWTISFTSTRIIQTSVANSFKSHIQILHHILFFLFIIFVDAKVVASAGCTSPPCMYGISSGSSAPGINSFCSFFFLSLLTRYNTAQLNFYFGISFWYNSGMYQVYLGQGNGVCSHYWHVPFPSSLIITL